MNNMDNDKWPEYLVKKDRQHSFSTPPGYFDNLTDQIMEKVIAEDKKPRSIFMQRRPSPRWWTVGIAASILLAAIIFWPATKIDQTFVLDDSLSQDDIEEYVLQNLNEFDVYDLYELDPEMEDPFLLQLEESQDELDFLINDLILDLEVHTIEETL